MFADDVRNFAKDAWAAYVQHPFFDAAAVGSLSVTSFRFWLEQDLPYVVEYGYFRELFAQKAASDPRFSDLMDATTAAQWPGRDESAFLIELLRELGVEEPATDRFAARPAREGYMNHIARTVYEGTIGDMIAAILPCELGFTEWTARLAAGKSEDVHPTIARWIDHYATQEHEQCTDVSVALLNRAGELACDAERERMKLIFLRAVQHQIAVIDAAWLARDPWPDEVRPKLAEV